MKINTTKVLKLKNTKYFLSLAPLVVGAPLLVQSQSHVKASTEIKLVAISENEDSTTENKSTEQSAVVLNSEPKTGLTSTSPAQLSSDSKVAGYVPVNIINENKEKLKAEQQAKEAYKKLVDQRKAKALAEKKAQEQARIAEQAKLEQEKEREKLLKKQAEETKKEQESLQQSEAKSQTIPLNTPQQQTPELTESEPNYSGGLDMNQTSGIVDINALANYMASTVGGSVGKWAYTIQHESGGDLTNWFNKAGGNSYIQGSTAYGVFQLLGHGEYYGMTLKEQIEMAQQVYINAKGFSPWVASYSYGY